MTGEAPLPAEHQPVSVSPAPTAAPSEGQVARSPVDDPRALQILSTEHWSLLTARALAYNEAFARAGMFLTFLSASLIVIGFLIATESFAAAVVPATAILLGLDLFVGLATLGRLAYASNEEFTALKGMNRIRHAYSEMVPGIERYFVTSIHDDAKGVLTAFGDPTKVASPAVEMWHGITTAIGMVAVIDTILLAALATVIALGVGAALTVALAVGLAAFIVVFVVAAILGRRAALESAESRVDALFPSPD